MLAPADARDAFHKTIRAFNLADKYQMPVIILTDQFLADSHFSITDFEIDKAFPEFHLADPSRTNTYSRYRITPEGISPRLYPGQSEHLVGVDSDEHDEAGHITEDLAGTAKGMTEKRMAKYRGLKKEIRTPEEADLEKAAMNTGEKVPVGILYQEPAKTVFAQRFRNEVTRGPLTLLEPLAMEKTEQILSEFRAGEAYNARGFNRAFWGYYP